MDTGPGAASGQDRWRAMARLWSTSGVVPAAVSPVPAEPNPLSVSWDGANAAVAPGACFVNGFYGAALSPKQVPATVSGLVVARLDPVGQAISLVLLPGVPAGGHSQDPAGLWDVPLARLNDDGTVVDLRTWAAEPMGPPGLTAIPTWVPRGLLAMAEGPGADYSPGYGYYDLLVIYLGGVAGFEPGRNLRVTARVAFWMTAWKTNSYAGDHAFVDLYVRDDVFGVRRRQHLFGEQAYTQFTPPDYDHYCRFTSFTVKDVREGAVVVLNNDTTNQAYQYAANSCGVYVEDVGTG
jgi:hypothetical protein